MQGASLRFYLLCLVAFSPSAPTHPSGEYASPIVRFGGAAIDVIFLHILLKPLSVIAVDWSFRLQTIWPAVAFTILYFTVLLGMLRAGGLTPGGIPLRYRVVDKHGRPLALIRGILRLSPYILIQIVGLWRLDAVLESFAQTGDPYEFDRILRIVERHGGFLNFLVLALNLFVPIDLAAVVGSSRNQSLTDFLAGSFAITKSS